MEWPVPSTMRMVHTCYGETFVRISGPEGAMPMVLLSDLGGNSLHAIPIIEALSANYRTYAVDSVYDYGRSIPCRATDSIDDVINWLDELFDARFLVDVNLVGISYGGWMAGQYALRRLDRLRAASSWRRLLRPCP